MTPLVSLRVVTEWFDKAAIEAAAQGRHESAQLWRDGLAHIQNLHGIVKRQREAFLDLLSDTSRWSYEGEGERDSWMATGTVPLDTAAIDFGFDSAQEAFDLIEKASPLLDDPDYQQ